jgi:hypothetical protein
MSRLTTFVAGAVTALLCVAGFTWRQWVPLMHETPIQKVEAGVRRNLKDPESARFERVTFNPATGAGCGYVNARNSMGGYSGFEAFILYRHGRIDFQDMSEPESHDSAQARLEKLQKQVAFLEAVKSECAP